MAFVSAMTEVVSWFTTFDDPYRVTPVAFLLFGLFLGLFGLHEHLAAEQLRAAAQPLLRLAFGNGQMFDSLHHDGRLRIFRVGVLNAGASVSNVAVKVARVHPELPRVFPMQELQQTHGDDGVSRFTVNKSDEPLVFVDVVHQRLHAEAGTASGITRGQPWAKPFRKGETFKMAFAFADGTRDLMPSGAHPTEPYGEQYLIWLVIDGAGAEASRKFVLRRNEQGSYGLSEAFT
jgi:hypothetical protein